MQKKLSRAPISVALMLIRAYQRLVSPLLSKNCRFSPTCSAYTYTAIEHHGVLAGIGLGARRFSRCHPWHEGGFDPVPSPEEHTT